MLLSSNQAYHKCNLKINEEDTLKGAATVFSWDDAL